MTSTFSESYIECYEREPLFPVLLELHCVFVGIVKYVVSTISKDPQRAIGLNILMILALILIVIVGYMVLRAFLRWWFSNLLGSKGRNWEFEYYDLKEDYDELMQKSKEKDVIEKKDD